MQAFFPVDAVEDALEVVELLERWFTHQVQHMVAGMFRSHLQSSADMAGDEFTGIIHGCLVGSVVLTSVQQQVVTHTAADKAFLDFWQGIDGMVDLQQLGVVGVEVRANLWMDTTGSFALFADVQVVSMHAVHIG